MRPSLHGQYVKYNNKGELCAVNLGFNFYAEHQEGTQDLVRKVNDNHFNILEDIKYKGYKGIRAEMFYKKALKKEQQVISRWDNTPFVGFVLSPNAEMFTRKIKIRYSEQAMQKYKQFQLKNECDYEMLVVSDHWGIDYWQQNLGKKRIFCEDEIMIMSDYQNQRVLPAPVHGSWAQDGFMILFESTDEQGHDGKVAINELESAIKRGCLAVVPKEPRIFGDNWGCCLIILDKSYGVA